jgi:3',5'-cyclic AMP phosphodiesterase CpdA
MTVFSYLHLTDLHLCQQPYRKNALSLKQRPWHEIIDTVRAQRRELGFSSFFLPVSYDPEIARGVAQFCQEWSEAVDGIIITGDLATTGLTIDVAVAEKFVKEPAASGFISASRFPTIASLNLPIHLFAGNHDRYTNILAKPYSNHFDFVFEDYMNRKSEFVGSWVSQKGGKQLAFVHADFTLRTRMEATSPQLKNAFGQGRVYDDILSDLRDESFSIRRDFSGADLIWMVHFAPYETDASIRFIDHQKLIDAANALGVRAIICGHTHEALAKELASQTIYCGGSSCCIENVGGCMVHVLDFDLGASFEMSRKTFVWSEDQGEFVFFKND